MAKRKREPERQHDVAIEHNGKRYEGTYTERSGVVTVHGFGVGTQATQVGGSSAKTIAQWLLRELVVKSEEPTPPTDIAKAMHEGGKYLGEQAQATPGRKVSFGEFETKLGNQGYSPAQAFEAWRQLKQDSFKKSKS